MANENKKPKPTPPPPPAGPPPRFIFNKGVLKVKPNNNDSKKWNLEHHFTIFCVYRSKYFTIHIAWFTALPYNKENEVGHGSKIVITKHDWKNHFYIRFLSGS